MSNTFYKVKKKYKFSHILDCLVENRLLSLMIFFLFSDFRHLFCIHIAMWCECPESQVGLQWLTRQQLTVCVTVHSGQESETRQQLTVCVPVHSGQESELSLCYRLFSTTSFYFLTAMSMLSENLRYLYNECSELCDSFHVKNSLFTHWNSWVRSSIKQYMQFRFYLKTFILSYLQFYLMCNAFWIWNMYACTIFLFLRVSYR